MGYTTDFDGKFTLDRPLSPAHREYLTAFNETRRMKRDEAIAAALPDPAREAAGLPIGPEGAYFVGATGSMGQDRDASVLDYNRPPEGQPGLWCEWVPDAEGKAVVWDEGEKFYSCSAWLEYLIANFLVPWGYTLDGEVRWRGEDFDDVGTIVVAGNVVTNREATW